MKLSSRKQLLNEADKDLKRMQKSLGLNEDVDKVLKDVRSSVGDKIYDDFSTMKEKFFTEQTKKLNARYKSQLQKYVGQEFTQELGDKLFSGRSRFSPRNIGKKITSMDFVVRENWGDLQTMLVVKLEGGKEFEVLA